MNRDETFKPIADLAGAALEKLAAGGSASEHPYLAPTNYADPQVQRAFTVQALLQSAGIPRRLAEKGLATYVADTPGRRDALATVRRWLERVDAMAPGAPTGLLLYGAPGTGKTHLLCAALAERIRTCRAGLYLSPADWFPKVRATFKDGADETESDLLEEILGSDFQGRPLIHTLLIDDIGAGKDKASDWEREKYYQLVNGRYEMGGGELLITCNQAFPDGLEPIIGQRVISRLYELCRIFPIEGVDDYRLKFQK